mmetsp:Transcript_52900/g.97880  ORF Transcript_52900/g.97880 Transcript_52900/m.97880 type:complete len:407 (-) Transcript_52900:202-1422(-)
MQVDSDDDSLPSLPPDEVPDPGFMTRTSGSSSSEGWTSRPMGSQVFPPAYHPQPPDLAAQRSSGYPSNPLSPGNGSGRVFASAGSSAPPSLPSKPLCKRCGQWPTFDGNPGFCSRTCRDGGNAPQAQGASNPPLATALAPSDPKFQSVWSQFKNRWNPKSWGWGDVFMPIVCNIFALHLPDQYQKFEAKRKKILQSRPGLKLHGQHAGPGNCQRRFHGTRMKCNFNGTPCKDPKCSACMIMTNGKLQLQKNGTHTGKRGSYGDGLYFTSASHTAKGYGLADGVPHPKDKASLPHFVSQRAGNCVLVVHVLAGATDSGGGTGVLDTAKYDSRVVNKSTGNDELVIWDEDQVLPAYVITFSGPGKAVDPVPPWKQPQAAKPMCQRCHVFPTFNGKPGYCSLKCRDNVG